MRRSRFTALAFAVLLPLAAPGAEITGKVVLSGEPAADAVISVEGLNTDGSLDSAVHVVDHRDLDFVPHIVVARTGATVLFKNSDGMPCRLYSISPAGTFVMRRQEGKPMTIPLNRPGVIQLRCADHDRIHAYIVIKENPYFGVTDSKGEYKISGMPAGRHTLQLWYEGRVIKTKAVKVGDGKLSVDFQGSQRKMRADAAPAGLFFNSPEATK